GVAHADTCTRRYVRPITNSARSVIAGAMGSIRDLRDLRATARAATQQAFLIHQHVADLDAVVVDVVKPQFVGVHACAHLHHGHHSLQTAVEFDVALHDDRVGHEGVAV